MPTLHLGRWRYTINTMQRALVVEHGPRRTCTVCHGTGSWPNPNPEEFPDCYQCQDPREVGRIRFWFRRSPNPWPHSRALFHVGKWSCQLTARFNGAPVLVIEHGPYRDCHECRGSGWSSPTAEEPYPCSQCEPSRRMITAPLWSRSRPKPWADEPPF